MEQPEQLWGTPAGPNGLVPPSGPAFHVSFAVVSGPPSPMPVLGAVTPYPVVLIGHFQDRRAELCDATDRQGCGETFIVDRVASLDGAEHPVRTQRWTDATPSDLEQDVDALVATVAPNAIVVSRQLLPVEQVFAIEPILASDLVVPYIDQSKLAWLVTTVDVRDRQPVARTFMLLDGSNWFAELTADGAFGLERRAPEPSAGAYPAAPSADPAAWVGAPTSILGIPVGTIGSVMHDRQVTEDDLGRDEFAIGAWYVAPNPAAVCETPSPIHPPTPPCDDARHWLLGDPVQNGVEQGQLRRDPEQWPRVLNPLLPIDVPFEVGDTWRGDVPLPQPVIVLGHFNDTRVDGYRGNVFFIIDALAWTRDRPAGPLDSIVRLTDQATEDSAAVLARIGDVSPNDAVATWATALDATDFAQLDPRSAETMPEFTTGAPVWTVRRLVHSVRDGRQRLAIEWAWTADHGRRVWWTETPNSSPDLGTSLDLRDLDPNTTLLRVFDYDQQITSVAPLAGLGSLSWQRLGPVREIGLDVARGRTANEVAIRWLGEACDATWRLEVHGAGEAGTVLAPWRSGDCESERVARRLVIQFDHAVDVDRFRTTEPCCG